MFSRCLKSSKLYGKELHNITEKPCSFYIVNPLPYMPILGSPNSAANKDMMLKIWTNGDKII